MAPLLATYALLASYAGEWLDLIFRWFHVTAAVVWIGTSFYFVALDNHLREPEREQDRRERVRSGVWESHRRGIFLIREEPLAPTHQPKAPHWVHQEGHYTVRSRLALVYRIYYASV